MPDMIAQREHPLSRIYDQAGIALLPIGAIIMLLALLPIGASSFDMREFYIPWMTAVRAGGLSSLSAEFADYTPPYIYLMYLASALTPFVGMVAAIKLMAVPFVAIMAAGVNGIVARASGDRKTAILAAAVLCVAPTVQVNAFLWGQADAIYASFLVLVLYFACCRSPVRAMLMFGVALSFKMQAMFLSPFLLYLVLSKQARVWTLLLIPAAYATMMLPAAIAGRPWAELLSVYLNQGHAFRALSMSAPNPWFLAQRWQMLSYETGLMIGLPAAAIAGLAIATGATRLREGAATNLLVATLCATMMPYILPKMHDRYFFVADVLTLTLAFARPRYWPAAVLVQLGSLAAYLDYFGLSHRGPFFGFVLMTLALGVLLLGFVEAGSHNSVSSGAIFRRLHDGLRFRSADPEVT